VSPAAEGDFTVVQFPHRAGQVWAALPEAWIQPDGVAPDPKDAPPEELTNFLADRPGVKYKNIQRTAPTLTIACHCPGGPGGFAAPAADTTLAAMVCDEWAEFIPDPFQTAGIGFHYDAPGARPPQSIVLALPPRVDQDAWTFDDLLDVIHEAFDLAKLRSVRPQDLKGGLGALLPGNYLPQTYTATRRAGAQDATRRDGPPGEGERQRGRPRVHARQSLEASRKLTCRFPSTKPRRSTRTSRC
jgi:hypothetical protein